MLKSRIVLNFSTAGGVTTKIYTYKGRTNLCGDRVREARAMRRMTQADLAARMQIEGIIMERDSISRIEIGTRFVADYELVVLSKIFGVSLDWLTEPQEF
jgi:transcriptional regulator with XRE-family HTH domain